MSERPVKTRIATKNFEVLLFADTPEGCFEHNELGDECGGGLWFEEVNAVVTLVDYDGVACLPREVWYALELAGVVVEEDFK